MHTAYIIAWILLLVPLLCICCVAAHDVRMERGMVLCLFCCLPCWVSGSSQVQCSADKGTVPVGGSVTMRCKLNSDCNTQDILQVTWSKQSGEFAGTIATSSRSHGQRFLGPYSNRKVRFAEEIQNCSAITIGSVTPGDQGCFQCIFNIYPLGASMGSVCLDITEASISDPKLEINLDSNNDHVISCSATGKPAPKITWNVTRTLEQKPQNYSINHPDQTVTVISNFTHRTLGRIHVTCVVHHPSLSSDIVLSKAIEDSQFFETSNSLSMTSLMIAAIVAAIPILIIIFYVIVHLCMKEHIIHKHLRICTEKYKEKPKVSPDLTDYQKCDEDV